MIKAGDILILQGEPAALERIVALEKLQADARRQEPRDRHAERRDRRHGGGDHARTRRWSAAPSASSSCSTATPSICSPSSRKGRRITHRLRSVKLRAGDVVVLQRQSRRHAGDARRAALPAAGRARSSHRPQGEPACRSLVLAAAMGLVAFNVVPVADRLLRRGGRSCCLPARSRLREAYDAIDWPILIMLGALIPVSDALRTTGGTDLIAGWLSHAASHAAADRARSRCCSPPPWR